MIFATELALQQALSCAVVAVYFFLLTLTALKAPHIVIANIFIIFSFTWRMVATLYIDLFGPVYAEQIYQSLGPGGVGALHGAIYVLILGVLNLIMSEQLLRHFIRPSHSIPRLDRATFTLADLYFWAAVLYIAALYVDMMRIGVIPLLEKMERYTYSNLYGGAFHGFLMEYGNLLFFQLGAVFAYAKIVSGRLELRFLILILFIFAYCFLTGHRFSTFYSFTSYFIAPYAAAILYERCMGETTRRPGHARLPSLLGRRELSFVAIVGVTGTAFVSYAIYHNLVYVRDFVSDDAVAKFFQRVLVQPSELGWASHRRVFEKGEWYPDQAFDFVFLNAIDMSRNTAVQYLMLRTVDLDVVYHHIGGGFQFAGGFPEIYFELFEPWLAVVMIFLAVLCASFLTMLCLIGVLRGWFMTVFWAAYVLYGFNVMYIGGMVHFMLTWTYWIKILALFASLVVEGRGLWRIPWVLMVGEGVARPRSA